MVQRRLKSFILILIMLQLLIVAVVQSFSILPGGTGNSGNGGLKGGNSGSSSRINHISHQAQQVTTLPSLMSTIVQESNYTDSMLLQQQQQQQNYKQQQQQYQQKQQQQQDIVASLQQDVLKSKSNYEEHDDSVPLATINNHSRNMAAMKPPQYVDVSALVGREKNLTLAPSVSGYVNSSINSNNISNGNVQSVGSILTAKSRSGLPECATQQVCNAIFVRMNYTQRLCECSSNYNWKCSHNLDPQDGHTIELTRKFDKRIYTQIKTCEPLREVRACKSPTDWTLLALQSERSGKAHYVVVCKCPTWAQLEGPYTHNHPPYANIPGIRVYGMLCAHQTARSSSAQSYSAFNPALGIYPEFPWGEALNVLNTTNLMSTLGHH